MPDVERLHPGGLACIILAYTLPRQVQRLIRALEPFPVFLHCDAGAPAAVYREMTEGLPGRVTLLPRCRTPWGGWGCVEAEIQGYRRALETTDAAHLAVLSGTDYPLHPTDAMADTLAGFAGRSLTWTQPLPIPAWGHGGGFWRLRYRFAGWDKRMLPLPLPRRLPQGVVAAGGSAFKVLARRHAEAVVRAVDSRPDLVRRWRHTWIPDETFVPSILHTPWLVPGFREEHVFGNPWVIRWDGGSRKSPPWLTSADVPELRRLRDHPADGVPKLFARKFSTGLDPAVLDEVDRLLRGRVIPAGS